MNRHYGSANVGAKYLHINQNINKIPSFSKE